MKGRVAYMKKIILLSSLVLIRVNYVLPQWVQQPFPTSETLWKVRFVDSLNGWVLGHQFVYKTTDGGSTWIPQDTSMGAGFALSVLDANVAFYANYPGSTPSRGIRRTTDGGTTWQTVGTAQLYYTDFKFVTQETGYAVGGTIPESHPFVRKTTDGGTSWTTLWTGTGSFEFEAVSFPNQMKGWAVTYDAIIFHTTNGGVTWEPQDSIRPPAFGWLPVRDIFFLTADSGWAVGGVASNMLTARTVDGGENWLYTTTVGSSLREVLFLNNSLGWFVRAINGAPFVARSTDGGVTWVTQYPDPYTGNGFESISMANENLGWAVGHPSTIYKTTNGGVVTVDETPPGSPDRFTLRQNYPNPFNPATTIQYGLPYNSRVRLTIYNILGQEVKTLIDESQSARYHSVQWDGTNKKGAPVTSGIYFYRIEATGPTEAKSTHIQAKKMVLMR